MTLVDTNILLDLVTDDPKWADWSLAKLEAASIAGRVLINDVVYAELAVRYNRIEDLALLWQVFSGGRVFGIPKREFA
ncbi:type II toxin-antitoxin system VapC family toxin [Mesorhizobium kowhaii]|uniref:type II toxin-antitoxin system VapC family toxin n=1 Tax=Mesorhizobium kowhaii TaxID=1300272 RepID=UPI0035EE4833